YAESRLMLGSVQARLGQLPDAARTFIAAIRGQPAPAPDVALEMLYLLGHVYSKMDDPVRARSAFEHVQKESPGYKDVDQLLAALGAGSDGQPPPAAAVPPQAAPSPAATAPAPAPTQTPVMQLPAKRKPIPRDATSGVI